MSGSKFERAILHHATFDNGTLVGCSFDGAYLDFTHFISADLRFSSFGQADEGRFRDTEHTEYEEILVRRAQEYAKAHPEDTTLEHLEIARAVTSLKCADLRNARFSTRIFTMTPGSPRWFHPLGFVFSGADLRNADMSDMIIWGVKPSDSPFPLDAGVASTDWLSTDLIAYSIQYLGAWERGEPADISDYQEDLDFIRFCMLGSSWDQAILPASFVELLHDDQADLGVRTVGELAKLVDCRPRSPDLPLGDALALHHTVREQWMQVRSRGRIDVILPAALSSWALEALTALSLNSRTLPWLEPSVESTEDPPECLLEL